ncbi:ATP-binding cassette domain-containing protein [Oceanobacillus picturae]|uniref:ATP-binding cassette domain-containing protein n=1 Tax=Oceanobacillus picturae TaxID=171693 RepID=UPI0036439C78
MNLDENVIEVSQLGVQYDNKVWGIKDIDVTFKKGELIALVGANGAGKSTFLNALCGLIRPTKGDVFFNKNL